MKLHINLDCPPLNWYYMRKNKFLIWFKLLCFLGFCYWWPNATPNWFILLKSSCTNLWNVNWEMFHVHIHWSLNILTGLSIFFLTGGCTFDTVWKINLSLTTTCFYWIQAPTTVTAHTLPSVILPTFSFS